MSNVKKEIRYFSLFSGIGGFELGIGDKGKCVGFSEIDKYATQIYQHHFPGHEAYGDISKIDTATLPDFDLLCGGFPCQAFSIAGKRQGFDDTRGTLFFEIARLAAAKRPRLLFLENVKGLLSHDGGNTFQRIIFTLDELGYDLQWQVLNSKNHGVPQNRERVFIVGHLRGTPRPEVFPFGEGDDKFDFTDEESTGFRVPPITGQGGRNLRGAFVSEAVAGTINRGTFKETNGIALTLPASYYKGHDNHGARPMVAHTLKARADSGIDKKHPQTLIGSGTSIRRLTPTECERLQGFPDGWTEWGAKWVTTDKGQLAQERVLTSDTQRYKCLGNAVTVNVIEDIAKRLLAYALDSAFEDAALIEIHFR